ncbi:MAG: hypothetical protein IJ711_05095 [Lachnospiraceae bacterium]|nr:hypothetical protein [Lachnospiraceae bacterium]
MRKELPHFNIGKAYGGNQDWMLDPWMHLGGCAALTACDSCIYLALHKDMKKLYPFDKSSLTKKDYIRFSQVMKPYLRPRANGVDKLSIYVEGFGSYLQDVGVTKLQMEELSGEEPFLSAKEKVKEQIDAGLPVPYLLLYHQNAKLKEYVWHWFLLNGYEELENTFIVKAVTYGAYEWLDFASLWDTGHAARGGMILYRYAD